MKSSSHLRSLQKELHHIAKEEIENGDRVNCVKDHCAFIEDQFGPGVFMGLRNESYQVIVNDMTEEYV